MFLGSVFWPRWGLRPFLTYQSNWIPRQRWECSGEQTPLRNVHSKAPQMFPYPQKNSKNCNKNEETCQCFSEVICKALQIKNQYREAIMVR